MPHSLAHREAINHPEKPEISQTDGEKPLPDHILKIAMRVMLILAAMSAFAIDDVATAEDAGSSEPVSTAAKPNIVFLLADDLGWTGLGCFGSDFYETPNLDEFAKTGIKFTNAYAACTVCSPTRASIMTGMYPARLHLTDFIAGQNRPFARMKIPDWNKGLDHSYTTIAEALKTGGYTTALVGKWHLNHAGRNAREYGPQQHGFDFEFTKPPGTKGYQLRKGANPDGESGSEYATDYLTDQACKFIDEKHDQPFFLYFAYHTPHTPIQGREDLVARFQQKLKSNAVDRRPTHDNPTYAAMVASLDHSVGRILERLDRHSLTENTIVVFTSDNGGLTERYGKHDGFTENLPLRRGKGSAYEGGVRVPTLIRWPGHTPAGAVCEQPVMTIDYYPTLLEIAGVDGEPGHNANVDGKSLVPVLNDPAAALDRDLFWHYPHYHAGGDWPYSAIRSGNWRLIESLEDQHLELYDLARDLAESRNLADSQPDVAKQLKVKLDAWRTSVDAQMPTINPDFNPDRATQVSK